MQGCWISSSSQTVYCVESFDDLDFEVKAATVPHLYGTSPETTRPVELFFARILHSIQLKAR